LVMLLYHTYFYLRRQVMVVTVQGKDKAQIPPFLTREYSVGRHVFARRRGMEWPATRSHSPPSPFAVSTVRPSRVHAVLGVGGCSCTARMARAARSLMANSVGGSAESAGVSC
jgi:hypothetical protein